MVYSNNVRVDAYIGKDFNLSDIKVIADEIFEGNIASEMTLAEAISKDILPFPNYVGCIYAFSLEIEKRYEMIKKCSDEKKRKYLEKTKNS